MPAAWCEPDQESRVVLKIERFQPEGMNVRMSGGKPSYSHVVTVSGSGKIVYTAGQLARDVDGNCVGKGDMRAQMEQTFQNLDRCLKAAGATWADVVKTNTFVTDFDEFQKCADIRMRYLGVATPTSTTVGVTPVRRPGNPDPRRGAGLDDFDWHGGAITRATPVTPSYRSTQNVRRFLHAECGAGFKFDRPFMQWIKDGTPKTMGAVADEWRRRQGDAR
jgi:2-iminobutanoate/2-iminopropanoate deaminase